MPQSSTQFSSPAKSAQTPTKDAKSITLDPIGYIETPFRKLEDCPRNLRACEHETTLVLDPVFEPAMRELNATSHLIVLYWLDQSNRDVLRKVTPFDGIERGVFSTRSPNRPNPIGHAAVPILGIDGLKIKVGPMDCLSGTPLLDIKPYIASTDCYPDARLDWMDNLAPDLLADNPFTGKFA